MTDYYKLISEIQSKSRKKVILDTDTYNEVDDQFALSYLLLSDKNELLSVNAAPFLNGNSTSAGDGMEKSWREIGHIMELCGRSVPYYRGSERFLTSPGEPERSDAARNLIDTAMASSERVWVIAIGAITNVASALMMKPEIAERIAIIWLGGNSRTWPDTREFNLIQDIYASRHIFDCGVPLIQLPAMGVVSDMKTTVPELDYCLGGKNRLCDYLTGIVKSCAGDDPYCWSRIIWDIAGPALLTVPEEYSMVVTDAPIITLDGTYSFDAARHPMIYVRSLYRDKIFREIFKTLAQAKI